MMSQTQWKAVENVISFSERSIVIKLPVKRALWFSVYNWKAASYEYKQYCEIVLPNIFRPPIYRENGSRFDENMKKYNEDDAKCADLRQYLLNWEIMQ